MRGAFPENPTENGLVFIPIVFDRPLAPQLQGVDVILHKATDEISSIDINGTTDFAGGITFSKGMKELQSYLQGHPDCCVIDPLDSIYPLLDRHMVQQILLGLEDISTGSSCKIRAPRFLKVNDFNKPDLGEKLSHPQLCLPAIVKPQIACGLPDAHSMAIVFKTDDFAGLPVPLPAIVQEIIDHGSFLYKFYVVGDAIFHALRKFTPNAAVLSLSSANSGPKPIVFDSLKSLPMVAENSDSDINSRSVTSKQTLDVELVSNSALWLRRKLGLTIFGFDVVIQIGTGDHVIVDVNYLPSFKEIPDNVAIPAFW